MRCDNDYLCECPTDHKLAEIDDRAVKDRREVGVVAVRPQPTDPVPSLKSHGVEVFLAKAFQCCQASGAYRRRVSSSVTVL